MKGKLGKDGGFVLPMGFCVIVVYLLSKCSSFTDVFYVTIGSIFMSILIIILYIADKK
jgi:hypothetical protein